jgi:hypothetical protein
MPRWPYGVRDADHSQPSQAPTAANGSSPETTDSGSAPTACEATPPNLTFVISACYDPLRSAPLIDRIGRNAIGEGATFRLLRLGQSAALSFNSEVMMTRFTRIVWAHRIASLLCSSAIVGAAFAAVLLTRAPAASASLSQCASGEYCLWSDTSYSGTFFEFDNASDGTNHWFTLTDPPGDTSSSAYNHRQNIVYISHAIGDTSPPPNSKDCMVPGGQRGNLANFTYPDGTNENNNVSELDLIYSGTTC